MRLTTFVASFIVAVAFTVTINMLVTSIITAKLEHSLINSNSLNSGILNARPNLREQRQTNQERTPGRNKIYGPPLNVGPIVEASLHSNPFN